MNTGGVLPFRVRPFRPAGAVAAPGERGPGRGKCQIGHFSRLTPFPLRRPIFYTFDFLM